MQVLIEQQWQTQETSLNDFTSPPSMLQNVFKSDLLPWEIITDEAVFSAQPILLDLTKHELPFVKKERRIAAAEPI